MHKQLVSPNFTPNVYVVLILTNEIETTITMRTFSCMLYDMKQRASKQ